MPSLSLSFAVCVSPSRRQRHTLSLCTYKIKHKHRAAVDPPACPLVFLAYSMCEHFDYLSKECGFIFSIFLFLPPHEHFCVLTIILGVSTDTAAVACSTKGYGNAGQYVLLYTSTWRPKYYSIQCQRCLGGSGLFAGQPNPSTAHWENHLFMYLALCTRSCLKTNWSSPNVCLKVGKRIWTKMSLYAVAMENAPHLSWAQLKPWNVTTNQNCTKAVSTGFFKTVCFWLYQIWWTVASPWFFSKYLKNKHQIPIRFIFDRVSVCSTLDPIAQNKLIKKKGHILTHITWKCMWIYSIHLEGQKAPL